MIDEWVLNKFLLPGIPNDFQVVGPFEISSS